MEDKETDLQEQETSPEELYKMEASNLPDRVYSNDYKDTKRHEKKI